jgi:hypothetical protein
MENARSIRQIDSDARHAFVYNKHALTHREAMDLSESERSGARGATVLSQSLPSISSARRATVRFTAPLTIGGQMNHPISIRVFGAVDPLPVVASNTNTRMA